MILRLVSFFSLLLCFHHIYLLSGSVSSILSYPRIICPTSQWSSDITVFTELGGTRLLLRADMGSRVCLGYRWSRVTLPSSRGFNRMLRGWSTWNKSPATGSNEVSRSSGPQVAILPISSPSRWTLSNHNSYLRF